MRSRFSPSLERAGRVCRAPRRGAVIVRVRPTGGRARLPQSLRRAVRSGNVAVTFRPIWGRSGVGVDIGPDSPGVRGSSGVSPTRGGGRSCSRDTSGPRPDGATEYRSLRGLVFTHRAFLKHAPPDNTDVERADVRSVCALEAKTVRVVLRSRWYVPDLFGGSCRGTRSLAKTSRPCGGTESKIRRPANRSAATRSSSSAGTAARRSRSVAILGTAVDTGRAFDRLS